MNGFVLPGSARMLQLMRDFGFSIRRCRRTRPLVEVELRV